MCLHSIWLWTDRHMLTLKLPSASSQRTARKSLVMGISAETLLTHLLGALVAVGLYLLACLIQHLQH